MSHEEENPSVHELAHRTKKQQQQIDNTSGGWRQGTSRGYDPEGVFKILTKAAKQNNRHVKQGGIIIEDRRQRKLQQAFLNHTTDLQSQPWNRRGITMFDYLNGVGPE